MIDWTESMIQTFEYYIVDPNTWRDKEIIKTIKSSSITWDSSKETLASATFDLTGAIEECYIRIYLIAIQNGVKYKIVLGTFLVQTPSTTFDGRIDSVSVDAYSPLLELKENPPPLGYYVPKNENIMDTAYYIIREQTRAPVVKPKCEELQHSDFIANTDDTWLSYTSDLISNARYYLDLDEVGRILFAPKQELSSLQPIYTFSDDNSSILQPSITIDKDLYGIPNIIEVIYSDGVNHLFSRVVNDDPNSLTSTVKRGRNILKRITNSSFPGVPTQAQIDEYANTSLKSLSELQCTVSYTHGYYPIHIGNCVRLNYKRANLIDVKARVISQQINCSAGCSVTEKAVFTANLWG